MLIIPILFVVAVAGLMLFRHLRARADARTLWRSSLKIGSSIGIARAVLAGVGWYGLGHTAGVLQIPSYMLALLALPEAIVFGRSRGPVPFQQYVLLGLFLVATSLLAVCGVAIAVKATQERRGA